MSLGGVLVRLGGIGEIEDLVDLDAKRALLDHRDEVHEPGVIGLDQKARGTLATLTGTL